MKFKMYSLHWFALLVSCLVLHTAWTQDKSVKPGINDSFKNPDVDRLVERFEGESREVYTKRNEILDICKIKPGFAVADVGAGTGFYSRLFSQKVGSEGKVYAVDISEKLLDHINKMSEQEKITNIETVLCTQTTTELKPNSVDVVFVCDTYHHFEFPFRTLDSIHKALKPNGTLVVIDFYRIEGKSREWLLNHVRAGKGVFAREIISSGFEQIEDIENILEENYILRFRKKSTD